MNARKQLLATASLLVLFGCGRAGQEGTGQRGGLIQNKGSDTLVNVAQAWAEAYRDVDENVAVAVSGGGSGTGFAALINGTVDMNVSHTGETKTAQGLPCAVPGSGQRLPDPDGGGHRQEGLPRERNLHEYRG